MGIIYYTTFPPFKHYFQPRTLNEVLSLLSKYGDEARIHAGGTDLLVLMRNRALAPKSVIDISRVTGLDYIVYDEEKGLKIGALAKLKTVALSEKVKEKYPLLHEAASQLGTTQVKNMGTVLGNICRASPSADMASPLLTLSSSVEILGSKGARIVPIEQFFTGPGITVLKNNEIAIEIQVPRLPVRTGTAFLKLTRVAEDLAKVNVASVLTFEDGNCIDARIALGGVAPTSIRARKAEEILRGNELKAEVVAAAAQAAADETEPITDVRSTQEYRKELTKVLVKRAIKICRERAQRKKGG